MWFDVDSYLGVGRLNWSRLKRGELSASIKA